MRLRDVSVDSDGGNLILGLDSGSGVQDVLELDQRGRAPEFIRNTDKIKAWRWRRVFSLCKIGLDTELSIDGRQTCLVERHLRLLAAWCTRSQIREPGEDQHS